MSDTETIAQVEERVGDEQEEDTRELSDEEEERKKPPPPPPSSVPDSDAARQPQDRKRKMGDMDDRDFDNESHKRRKEHCYRCGGVGHFHFLCPSPYDAIDGPSGTVCYTCNGKGHTQRRCPNNLPPQCCYRCGTFGHRARECGMNMGMGGMGAGGGYGRGQWGGYGPGGYGPPPYGQPPMMGGPMMGGPPPPRGCYRCGQTGHFARECTQAEQKVCYRCHQEGHIAKDCNYCINCKQTGHFVKDCPYERTHPSQSSVSAAPHQPQHVQPSQSGMNMPMNYGYPQHSYYSQGYQ